MSVNNPALCSACHTRIFKEWNGSMMANSWRDPGWRGAFLLLSRLTATDGNCDIPQPPDGTPKAQLNPFANADCSSTFDLGTSTHTTTGSGSLLDDFCSRCHMPTNYVDQVDLSHVTHDTPSGLEHGLVNPTFDPTSANGTDTAFATVADTFRNTESGKSGVVCKVCHAFVESRYTPYHNYPRSGTEYIPSRGRRPREDLMPPPYRDIRSVPDGTTPNLGWGVGSGAYRLSPHAISTPERFGPLTFQDESTKRDDYVSDVFDRDLRSQPGRFTIHKGYQHVMFERAEYCSACHDVTNPLTIKNEQGKWVGGFPIERTYAEWANSRYAARPGNPHYDPAFKRDCQTCHMQQDYGQPGTAQTLYVDGEPVAPLSDKVWVGGEVRPVYYSHHFIGGNAYITRLLGADLDAQHKVAPYPELSVYSFSSASKTSPYNNAFWTTTDGGPKTNHARLAWDRLRNVLDLQLTGPAWADAGTVQPLSVRVTNTGSGHKFPTGFPEGRNAWVALRAFDLASGDELEIEDTVWKRASRGVGYLTDAEMVDPSFPDCHWKLPAGSPDPYAWQFKAVASLGDGCPTLALPYATPLNLVVNAKGIPIDADGKVIDRTHPLGLPQFRDLDGDGDLYDDAFLMDTRLRPLPHPDASVHLDRYAVIIPAGAEGPVAVTAAVYYQSLEAMVAKKLLGNLADTDLDFTLEPCVLKGACDGRVATVEPAVVEGAPPVPMEVITIVIGINGHQDTTPPTARTYPAAEATDVYEDVVVKVSFSEPILGIDATTFTLSDAQGQPVPARVAQIGDYTWGLYPHRIFLTLGERYTARVAAPICDLSTNCLEQDLRWMFQITSTRGGGQGDTRIPLGTLPFKVVQAGQPTRELAISDESPAESTRLDKQQTLLKTLQEGIARLEEEQRQTLRKWLRESAVNASSIDAGLTQKVIVRLEEEQEQTLRQWSQAGQDHLPSLPSLLVAPETVSVQLPPECVAHLQEKKATLANGGYNREAWFHHVFECEVCCAPVLAEIMETHTSHVVEQPHTVVLFDFDTYRIKDSYQQQLDVLMQDFDQTHDQLLLIGRASPMGDRGYNITLSGQRAGEIKDYVMDKFDVEASRIRYLYFGYDPPQLTRAQADRYGITADDIASIDTEVENGAGNKINQSVVVVIYKGNDNHP